MEFSKKSKIILLSSILVILFSLVRIKIDNKSKYSLNDNYIYGQVIEKKVHNNRISIVVQAKEKVLLNYYDHDLDVELGNYIKAHGEFVQPKKNSVFNLFNYRNYLKK